MSETRDWKAFNRAWVEAVTPRTPEQIEKAVSRRESRCRRTWRRIETRISRHLTRAELRKWTQAHA